MFDDFLKMVPETEEFIPQLLEIIGNGQFHNGEFQARLSISVAV